MRDRPRPFDIVHVSSAHPWTDNRVHLRGAASAAAAGYRTALVAVAAAGRSADMDWDRPDPTTGVYVRRIPNRPRHRRVVVSAAQAVRAALSSRAQVVHLHDPELAWAVPLLRAAGRTVVYDAHEDLPDQVRGKEYLGRAGGRLAVAVAHLAVRVAGHADAVVAATPAIAERFSPGQALLVRNVPRLRASDDEAPPVDAREPIAVYLGALSRDRGIDVLTGVATAGRLPSGWRLVTAGPIDGAVDRVRFDDVVRAGGIEHLGVLQPGPARDLLLRARVGLLPLRPTRAYAAAIPTKLFEYLASGLGVIATDVPLWRDLLDGADCVTWVPPDDPVAVVEAIRRYDSNPDLLLRHARAGRSIVHDRFRWDHEERVLLDLYARLFRARPIEIGM